MPIGCSGEELGLALRTSLDQSAATSVHPMEERERLASLLALSGAASWAGFMREAKSVAVHVHDKYVFVPTHNGGSAGRGKGYHDLVDMACTYSSSISNSQIGVALVDAFSKCT